MIQVADVGLPRTKADPATGSPISVMDAPIGETVTRNGLIYEYQGIYAKLIGCTAAAKNQKKITIPDNIVVDDIYYEVRIIDCNALEYCTGLQKLVIGKNVRQIRYNAFHGDRSLERVKFLGKKLKQVGQNSFKDTGDMPVFRVPGAVKARYTRLIRQGSPSHWSLYRRLR